MKQFSTVIFLFLLAISPSINAANTTIFYSGNFGLVMPSRMLDDTKIIPLGYRTIAVKRSDESYFYGQAIDINFEGLIDELESLPNDFDIRQYPKYILGVSTEKELEFELPLTFKRYSKLLDSQYDLDNLEITHENGTAIYSLCSNGDCLAYVTNELVKDHILSITSSGVSEDEFKQILGKYLHVNQ